MQPRRGVLLLLLLAACFPCAVHTRAVAPGLPSFLQRGRSPVILAALNRQPSSTSSFPRELEAVLVALSAAGRDARALQPRSNLLSGSTVEEQVDEVTVRRQQEQEEKRRRAMRAEEPPLSLDLTFHILREMLQMARVEQLSNQADSNRKMMENIG